MSRNRFSLSLAVVFALSVLLVPATQVAAQSQLPIFEDEFLASVQIGQEVWVAPVALRLELEQQTGLSATVQTLGALLTQLPPASATNAVRFEGCWPAGQAAEDLDTLGYVVQTPVLPTLPSAAIAVRRTL